jgi:hypothetical protein
MVVPARRARDRSVTHAAAPEHRHAVAAADVAGEHRGAQSGHHTAAEQTCASGQARSSTLA